MDDADNITRTSKESANKRGWRKACLLCKRRKVKCDAQKPTCTQCMQIGVECSYGTTLQTQLVQSRETISTLESELAALREQIQGSERIRGAGEISTSTDLEPAHASSRVITQNGTATTAEAHAVEQASRRFKDYAKEHADHSGRRRKRRRSPSPFDDGMSLLPTEHDGGILPRMCSRKHGKRPAANGTSHMDGSQEGFLRIGGVEDGQSALYSGPNSVEARQTYFEIQSRVLGTYHELAASSLSASEGASVASLFKLFFEHLNPLQCFVYEPLFMRDMCQQGSYFNMFLLYAILTYASSAEGLQAKIEGSCPPSSYFSAKARSHMTEEIMKESTIATTQGVLLIAMCETTRGNTSAALNLTGLALRMVIDLELGTAPPMDAGTFAPLTFEEREAGTRLCWATYAWDKILSMITGSPPSIKLNRVRPTNAPNTILDDSQISGSPMRVTKTFRAMAEIAMVLDDITSVRQKSMIRKVALYEIRGLHAQLTRLKDDFASSLQLDGFDSESGMDSGSPHNTLFIHEIQLAMLYNAAYLYLYKPFLKQEHHSQKNEFLHICQTKTRQIYALTLQHEHSFGLHDFSFLNCYCIYLAASVVLHRLQKVSCKDDASYFRGCLSKFLDVLQHRSREDIGLRDAFEEIRLASRLWAPEMKSSVLASVPDLATQQTSTAMSQHQAFQEIGATIFREERADKSSQAELLASSTWFEQLAASLQSYDSLASKQSGV